MATEKRLIFLDEAMEATHKEVWWTKSEAAAIRSFLVKLPKVDAVEVVQGDWSIIEDDYCDLTGLKCSNCEKTWWFDEDESPISEYHYCPGCGAKMNGDGNA
jgi:hypothetical protein